MSGKERWAEKTGVRIREVSALDRCPDWRGVRKRGVTGKER